jgi:hypothetical protein
MLTRKQINYLNHGKIYKLQCLNTGKVYYGSTTMNLRLRLAQHKYFYKLHKQGKFHYCSSYEIIEGGNYEIYLVENYRCLEGYQLKQIEQVYIKNYPCVNMRKSRRTKEDNRIYARKFYNTEKGKQYKKDYYKKNRQKLKEYSLEKYRKRKALKIESLSRYKRNKQFKKLKY